MKSICKIYKKLSVMMAVAISCILLYSIPALAETQAVHEIGPGVPKIVEEPAQVEETSLGLFSISAYCSCEDCSSGQNLTFSGTVPQIDHTLSADLDLFPLGTKLRIGDIIYTVEDKGSSVIGNKLDIFFDSHEDALTHGLQEQEVYLIAKAEKTE